MIPKHIHRLLFFALPLLLGACSGINTVKVDEDLSVHTFYSTLSNVHLVNYQGNYFMVDAGVNGNEDRIENQLQALDIEPGELKFIFLTHGHADHAGTAAYFQGKYNVPILAGKKDTHMLKSGEIDSLCATNWLGAMIRVFVPESYPALEPDAVIDRPVSLKKYGIDGRIELLPGHTRGSMAIVLQNAAFVGDLVRGKAMARRIPAMHFYQCDMEQNKKDLAHALSWDCDIWFTGHFGPLRTARIKQWLSTDPYGLSEEESVAVTNPGS